MGSYGKCLVAADVGCDEKLAAAGLPASLLGPERRLVPASLLPDGITEEQRRAMRPDGLLVIEDGAGGAMGSERLVIIIEVKVANDTNPGGQAARAQAQHDRLAELLGSAGTGTKPSNITRATLVVGASGTIYQETRQALTQQLGVKPAAADAALDKAHTHACDWLHTIVAARRKAEAERGNRHPLLRPRTAGRIGRGGRRKAPP
jgi:hypothetical protein